MINWVLFVFIVRVILTASKTKAEKMGDSNVKMRTVSEFTSAIFKLLVSFKARFNLEGCTEIFYS